MASYRKTYLVTLLCVLAAAAEYQAKSLLFTDQIMSIKHEKWMAQHRRSYESKEERTKRFKIFKDNVEYIENFNRNGSHTYKLGINEFADLTNEEFRAKYAGSYTPSTFQKSQVSSFKYEYVSKVPPSLDWRQRNAVTPVQNQGACGCCWAFTAVAAMEGIAKIKSGRLVSLSEQHVLDCNYGGEGCRGGRMEHAMEFVKGNGGLASDAAYPYHASKGPCSAHKPSSLPVRITGYQRVPSNNETAMLLAVANQPVSAAVDPSRFQFYKSGVLTGPCGNKRTHAITAVGYGTTKDGIKYWLFKNSWGPNWGEKGYVRLHRDIKAAQGMCGIAVDLVYPTA